MAQVPKVTELALDRITELHSHRMVGVGRDLWGSSSSTPLLKQVDLQQAAQDHIQKGFELLHNPQPLRPACSSALSPSK